MIKAVFFDLNGVLITSELLSDRFQKEFGVSSSEFIEALKAAMTVARQPGAPSVYSLFLPHFKKWDLKIDEKRFLAFWFSGESVHKEALQYVKELHEKGIRVFVVSNNFRERTEYYRERFEEIFEHVTRAYFSWETGLIKPSEEALDLVLTENDLEPSEVVYFDDSAKNVEVAKNLGIDGQEWPGLEKAKEYLNIN